MRSPLRGHRPVAVALAALIATLALAGCLGEDGPSGAVEQLGPDDDVPTGRPTNDPAGPNPAAEGTNDGSATDDTNTTAPTNGTADNTTAGNQTSENTTNPPSNTTIPPVEEQPPRVWGKPEDALVRPGVNTVAAGASCTSNFLFKARDNDTYYLGSAAHCVQGVAIGDPVDIKDVNGRFAFRGTLAFDSWRAIGFEPEEGLTDDVHHFDFALIAIPAAEVDKVHPAVIHWGGPTKLASKDEVRILDRIINYGRSSLRLVDSPLNHQQGISTGTANAGWSIKGYMHSPGIPGDSGSGLMTFDGKAAGALSTVGLFPFAGENTWSSLPHAIEFLKGEGWPLELQTWGLLNPPAGPAT